MKNTLNKYRFKVGAVLSILTLLIAMSAGAEQVFAATLTQTSVVFTNMNTGGASSIIVGFKTSASNSGTAAGSLVLDNQAGTAAWTGTLASWTGHVVDTTYGGASCNTIIPGATVLPGSPTATNTVASGTVTITDSSSLTASTLYCYVLTSVVTTNPASAGQGMAMVTEGTDTVKQAEFDIISNDQIVVSATVPPSFTLSFGGVNTDQFTGNLSSGASNTTNGVSMTVTTNATSGWGLWAIDTNAGLTSVNAGHTISSGASGVSGNYAFGSNTNADHYGIGVTTANYTTNYNDTGGSNGGLLSNTQYNEIASAGTPTSSTTVTAKELADVAGNTPAATDYTDTITIVGAGSF